VLGAGLTTSESENLGVLINPKLNSIQQQSWLFFKEILAAVIKVLFSVEGQQ
jgi:hypothetical protein